MSYPQREVIIRCRLTKPRQYGDLGLCISRLKNLHSIMLPPMIEQDICYTAGPMFDDGHYSVSSDISDLSAFRYMIHSRLLPLGSRISASWKYEVSLSDVILSNHVTQPDDIKVCEGYNKVYQTLAVSIFALSPMLQTVWVEGHNLRFSWHWDVRIDRRLSNPDDVATMPPEITRGALRPAVGRVPAETHLPAFDQDNSKYPWAMNYDSIAKGKYYDSAPLTLAEWRRSSGD